MCPTHLEISELRLMDLCAAPLPTHTPHSPNRHSHRHRQTHLTDKGRNGHKRGAQLASRNHMVIKTRSCLGATPQTNATPQTYTRYGRDALATPHLRLSRLIQARHHSIAQFDRPAHCAQPHGARARHVCGGGEVGGGTGGALNNSSSSTNL